MRVVIQRVKHASVSVDGEIVSSIGVGYSQRTGSTAQVSGLLVLAGYETEDSHEDIQWMVQKIINLRIFNDEQGVMNKSMQDVGADLILVSQFTLHASTKKGNRPSYIRAARPEVAIPLYEATIKAFEEALQKPIGTGRFGADMQVELLNDGPVIICIDTKNKE